MVMVMVSNMYRETTRQDEVRGSSTCDRPLDVRNDGDDDDWILDDGDDDEYDYDDLG